MSSRLKSTHDPFTMSEVYALAAVSDDLLIKLSAHPTLGRYFKGIDAAKYTHMMTHVMQVMMTGKVCDVGTIARAHGGMKISQEDGDAWLAILDAVVSEYVHLSSDKDSMIENAKKCMEAIMGMAHAPISATHSEYTRHLDEARRSLDAMDSKTRADVVSMMSGI